MFTGIIQALGKIQKLDNRGSDIRLTVASSTLDMSDVALGDSIATNGVCLTVTDMGDDYYCADVSAETIKLTGFAHYSAGSVVNLEKAMRPTDRFGGHIVSGHVDAVNRAVELAKEKGAFPLFDAEAYLASGNMMNMDDDVREAIRDHGIRNALLTSIAPTGTIGLVMDCDTTGIEPDFALVKFKKLAGGEGVDVVYDAVGGNYAEPAVRALAWKGRYLVVGFPAGIPKIPLNLMLLKGCQIVGVFWGAHTLREPDLHAENMADLFRMYASGEIKPRISARFPLEKAADALNLMMDRKVLGKVVLDVD